MYLDSDRYNVLLALIIYEIDLTYISIPHIYKRFLMFFFLFIIIIFVIRQIAVVIWNTNRAYLRKLTGIRRLI